VRFWERDKLNWRLGRKKKRAPFFQGSFGSVVRRGLEPYPSDFALKLAAETSVQPFIDDERFIVGFEESFDFLVAQFPARRFFQANLFLKRENTVNRSD
jgi:hypothetical protein